MGIHPTAIISPEAEIDENVAIGPYSVIKGKARIGAGTRIENNVTIGCEEGVVEIGRDNHIYPCAVVGGPPQDLSYQGEATRLKIGNSNLIREFVTVNLGTEKGGGLTTLGDQNMLMAYVHIAHDCFLQDRIVIANSTHFAGHVRVEDDVKIGGGVLINQFITLGRHSYIAGDSAVNKDILPFSIAQGKYAVCRATNRVGMERSGIDKAVIENIHRAIRFTIKGDRTVEESIEKIKSECEPLDEVKEIIDFISNSSRGVAR